LTRGVARLNVKHDSFAPVFGKESSMWCRLFRLDGGERVISVRDALFTVVTDEQIDLTVCSGSGWSSCTAKDPGSTVRLVNKHTIEGKGVCMSKHLSRRAQLALLAAPGVVTALIIAAPNLAMVVMHG
jgi:hypothetical protein